VSLVKAFAHSQTQRANTFIVSTYGNDRGFEAALAFSRALWEPPNLDVTTTDGIRQALAGIFTQNELDDILVGLSAPETKKKLIDTTDEALEHGAYGAPWFWVTNSAGKSEPFFGSDRFQHMYQFLDIPFQDIKILKKGETAKL
jgi:glutathione S-transferase kappa 1